MPRREINRLVSTGRDVVCRLIKVIGLRHCQRPYKRQKQICQHLPKLAMLHAIVEGKLSKIRSEQAQLGTSMATSDEEYKPRLSDTYA